MANPSRTLRSRYRSAGTPSSGSRKIAARQSNRFDFLTTVPAPVIDASEAESPVAVDPPTTTTTTTQEPATNTTHAGEDQPFIVNFLSDIPTSLRFSAGAPTMDLDASDVTSGPQREGETRDEQEAKADEALTHRSPHSGSTVILGPRPPYGPLPYDLPTHQLERLEKGRTFITKMADEVRDIRRELCLLSDRLLIVDVAIENILRDL